MTEETTEKKSNTITIKRDALWKYSTFVLGGLLVLGLIFMILPNNGSVTGNATGNPGGPSAGGNLKVEVTEEDNFLLGDINSEVIVVEYSDFECPFCARAYSDAVSQIKSTYTDGSVAIVYRHFPLTSIHPNAQKAAEASECAAEQGKFEEYHNMLFESGVSGGVSTYKAYASQLGLNTAQFNSCLDSGKYASKVSTQTRNGQSLGITGTPGFIIGSADNGMISEGKLVSGAQPFTVFDQLIQAEL